MHVLGLPPAFVLSQDQTLKLRLLAAACSARRPGPQPARRAWRTQTGVFHRLRRGPKPVPPDGSNACVYTGVDAPPPTLLFPLHNVIQPEPLGPPTEALVGSRGQCAPHPRAGSAAARATCIRPPLASVKHGEDAKQNFRVRHPTQSNNITISDSCDKALAVDQCRARAAVLIAPWLR